MSGDVDPTHPIIQKLVALKDASYGELLRLHGRPVTGADAFVRDFAKTFDIEDANAIASTGNFKDIATFLAMHNLTDLFPDERIIDGARVTHPKPHPEGFDKAFRTLALPEDARQSVVAFEDDPRGMLAARKAGLFVCAITTRYSREVLEGVEAQPDYIADSYDEFRDYFKM